MRRFPQLLATILLLTAATTTFASGRYGEIHEYCGEAIAIVIGSPGPITEKDPSCEFKVEQWLKSPPAGTQPATQPATLRLNGGPGTFEGQSFLSFKGGQTYGKLAEKGRFLVFVFAENRTGDGRLGSIIELGDKGQLPASIEMKCLDPQPKTADELVAQIKRVLSKEYRDEQIALLANAKAQGSERSDAAMHLGALYCREAWETLETASKSPELTSTSYVALKALYRIDPAKALPVCLSVVQTGQYETQVDVAAWLLSRRNSADPKASEILLAAALRWEKQLGYAADHPLPSLIQAITGLKNTPEFEALVMRCLEKGEGNIAVTAMYAAGGYKIRRGIPFICKHLTSSDKPIDLKSSASLALATFVGGEATPYIAANPITEDEARQLAADTFPQWQKALAKATTTECMRGSKIVTAPIDGGEVYIAVTWKQQATLPVHTAILLYNSSAKENGK